MWNDPQPPLIPANAGTQMVALCCALEGRSAKSNSRWRYAIWVPAFAVMSGVEQ